MKNAIITGATSFIGIYLIKMLLDNDYFVTAVVRPNSVHLSRIPKNDRITVIELDMQEIKLLPVKVDKKKNYEIFYHLAWDGSRIPYRDDKLLQEVNYINAVSAFETALVMDCKTFVGTGSQAELGKCVGKITEEHEAYPITEYGKAKLKTYNKLMEMANAYNIKFIWTRLFSAYGIYDYAGTLISSTITKMMKNEEILLTKCLQNWDFIYIEDVAEALYLLGSAKCSGGIYNIASGISKPLKEFVVDMKKITNSKSNLIFGAIPYGSEGIVNFEPVVDKLKNKLNWACKVTFEEGIEKIMAHSIKEGNL